MADSYIQLPGDSTGKQVDTRLVQNTLSTEVHREVHVVGDGFSSQGLATVTSSAGLEVKVTNPSTAVNVANTVTVIGVVTATAATNPWSSAPGFNVPVVSVSSGLVQISGIATVASASSGLIQISGIPTVLVSTSSGMGANTVWSLSSGTVTLSSVHTVTATAGTNPWSSAPGFNVPVVSVSSGFVQISGTPTVTATAGTNPWSSAPGFNLPVISASSGEVQVVLTSENALAPTYIIATSIHKLSSSPCTLWKIAGYTTSTGTLATGIPGILRLYNASTSSVTAGTNVVASFLVGMLATSTGGSLAGSAFGGDQTVNFGPRGMSFATACSVDVGTLSTGTATLTNAKVTALVSTA